MQKFIPFTTFFYCLCFCASSVLVAQNTPPTTNYYKETFSTGFGKWQTKQLNNTFKWTVTKKGPLDKNTSGQPVPPGVIDPPLKSNGDNWVILDSYLAGNFPNAQKIDATLYSPRYDCSQFNEIYLRMNTLFRRFVDDEKVRVGVSTDSITFEYIDLFTDLEENMFCDKKYTYLKTQNPYTLTLQLPAKYAQKSKLWLNFRYTTSESLNYSWQIDDIELFGSDPTPLCDLALRDDFFALSPYRVIPKSQLDSIPFLCDLNNNSLLDKKEVVVRVEVKDLATKQLVFSTEEKIDFFAKKSNWDNYYLKTKFLPPAKIAAYQVVYKIKDICDDEFPKNNQMTYYFDVSEDIFQKEKGKPTRSVYPETETDWSYGNHFYFKKGKGYKATHISFALHQPDNIAGDSLATLLYSWEDLNNNEEAEPAELDLIAKTKKVVPASSPDGNFSFPLNSVKGTKEVLLDDAKDYLAVVEYSDMKTKNNELMQMLVCDTLFYNATYFTSIKSDNHKIFNSVLKIGKDANYSLVGFDIPMTPTVRLKIEKLPTKSEENINISNNINIFPNPAHDEIFIQNIDNEYFINKIIIKNILGQAIVTQEAQNKINVSALKNGIYFLEIHTPKGTGTKQFIKQ
jgi:Secretion system C-terminal sorting domain